MKTSSETPLLQLLRCYPISWVVSRMNVRVAQYHFGLCVLWKWCCKKTFSYEPNFVKCNKEKIVRSSNLFVLPHTFLFWYKSHKGKTEEEIDLKQDQMRKKGLVKNEDDSNSDWNTNTRLRPIFEPQKITHKRRQKAWLGSIIPSVLQSAMY